MGDRLFDYAWRQVIKQSNCKENKKGCITQVSKAVCYFLRGAICTLGKLNIFLCSLIKGELSPCVARMRTTKLLPV